MEIVECVCPRCGSEQWKEIVDESADLARVDVSCLACGWEGPMEELVQVRGKRLTAIHSRARR